MVCKVYFEIPLRHLYSIFLFYTSTIKINFIKILVLPNVLHIYLIQIQYLTLYLGACLSTQRSSSMTTVFLHVFCVFFFDF